MSEVQWSKWSLDEDRCWLGQDVNIVEIIILCPAIHLIWIKYNESEHYEIMQTAHTSRN